MYVSIIVGDFTIPLSQVKGNDVNMFDDFPVNAVLVALLMFLLKKTTS